MMRFHGLEYVNPYLNAGKPDIGGLHKKMTRAAHINPHSLTTNKTKRSLSAISRSTKHPSRREEFEILMSKQMDYSDMKKQ